MVLMLESGL